MKKLVAALLVGTMCFGLVGCGQTADTSADAPAETTTEDVADAADEAAADDGEVFIGLAMHNQTETWAVQFADTFKEEAEAAVFIIYRFGKALCFTFIILVCKIHKVNKTA